MKTKLALAILFPLFLNACSSACGIFGCRPLNSCEINQFTGDCHPPAKDIAVEKYYANEENAITLLKQRTGVLVHCYTTKKMLAETCAQYYEKDGFVRVREIPLKTADYDFLKNDTFPTRRWRRGERTPRW